MKTFFSLLSIKRALQTFVVFCMLGFIFEIMPNKILFAFLVGMILLYFIDIIDDVKTLNERLDNHVVVTSTLTFENKEYYLAYFEPIDKIRGKQWSTENNCIGKIMKVGKIDYIALYQKSN